ncbi:dienelactone hydrolase endo-1-3,1,4-beta-D-glucanase [Roridomyces roridus]|uniref:Dienelactone hydrolase endo-1-3,1,4-beta-D-glucanase n=1 Tax=Roridomyces roridus TaxID=1738132 RepID=A0AAD7CD73_9AGAR|nr:dienelactone hydrolase endo-1-3,1,4-beta-D-glucanase [Roridomyces roridus]
MSCPDCFRGNALDGEPTGVMQDGAYFAAGPAGNTKRAIILLTDIFGLPLNNPKILADSYSQHLQCDVWVPDLFEGRPPVTPAQLQALPQKAGEKLGFFGLIKLVFAALPSLPAMYRTRPPVVAPRTAVWIKKLQAEKKYEKLGTIGYCFGGGIALELGSTDKDLFQSIILAHPSPPKDEQIKAIKAPTAWCCAEEDMAIKPARVNEIEAIYAGRKDKPDFVDYEIKVHKGTTHGFAARPRLDYPEVKEAFEQAFEQSVSWFNKTIPA